jgi:hypothetical protein
MFVILLLLVVGPCSRILLRDRGPEDPSGAEVLQGGPRGEMPVPPADLVAVPEPQPAAVAIPPVASPTRGETSLRVRATWAFDGTPAAGIGLQVVFWGEANPRRTAREVRTDAQGEWFAAPVPTGRVSAYSDRSTSAGADVLPGEETVIDLALPAGVLVRGVVQDDAGSPVPGAAIWLSSPGNWSEGRVVGEADDRGRFELREVGDGRHVGARSAEHAPSGLFKLDGQPGDVLDVVLMVGGACGSVKGRVVDPEGRGVGGASLRVEGWDGGWHGQQIPDGSRRLPPAAMLATSADDGTFAFHGVPVGKQRLLAARSGFSMAEVAVVVQADTEAEPTVRLAASASVRGTVRDAAGRPVVGAQILIGEFGLFASSDTTTGPDGCYELTDLVLGWRILQASSPDHGRAAESLVVTEGAELTCDLVLTLGRSITGTLLDADGAPAPKWLLVAQPEGEGLGQDSSARSRADGSFTLHRLADAQQRVVVMGRDLGNFQVLLAEHVKPGNEGLVLRLPRDVGVLGHVTGRVVTTDDRVPDGWDVGVAPAWQPGWGMQVEQDASTGTFRAGPLCTGSYEVRASAPGLLETVVGPWELASGGSVDVGDVVLGTGGTLLVRLSAGLSLDEGWILGAIDRPGGQPGRALEREGTFLRSKPLAAGHYELRIAAQRFAPVRRLVEVFSDAETVVDVSLEPGVQQVVRVMAGPIVFSSPGNRRMRLVVTGAGGTGVVDADRELPPYEGPPLDADIPWFETVFVLEDGSYLVAVSIETPDETWTASGDFVASESSPWVLDLR